uniref:Bcl-2 protein n=1 Tax=Tetranychus cinnabarinus TaxID=93129 RepID=A0A2L1GE95_TETCI|nr:Bcl-2 protein [Tetranychus cinnabarinus]
MSHYNKSSDRSVPFSTSRDNSTSDYFPLSSQSPRLGNSSFNSTRNKIFNNLSEFEDQLPSNKMFVDRSPFGSSFDHPRMMSGSRNLDMSNSFRDEMDDQVNHHPRVFNIPITVETPEGFVPLVRSNSNSGSHFSGNRGNMSQFTDPVASDFTYGSPSERPGYIHQRPVKSPTPPPKPKFSRNRPEFHNHHQSYHHNPEPYSYSHPRVHSIPVKIERSGKSQQPTRNDSNSPQPYDEVSHPNSPNHDTFFGGRRSRSSSESESHQPDVNRSVNIPIQIVKTQSSEPQNASKESNQPVNPPNPPQPCENKKKTPPDPIELINEIEKEACRLEKEVNEFNGEYLDKKYRYLDEMLTRCMLKLDSIDSNGRDEVRMARRSTLAHVDHCLAILEGKVNKPKPEENLDGTTNQCDEQAETATMESEPVQQLNEESISNESPVCEMSEGQKNDMMETENNSDETNISDEQEPKSTPVSDNVNTDESTCKADEMSFDQLDLETSSADSTRVYIDDTAHNSQSEQMSQDLEANESDNSPQPKVEFPPDDNLDELVDKESMDIEVKASPDSEEALHEHEQSISSTTEALVNEEKSNNEYRAEATEVQEPDSSSSPITNNSIEKQKKID